MAVSIDIADIARQRDRSFTGTWNGVTLRSAFQPIFAFQDSRLSIAAYEALARPYCQGDEMPPDQFFPTVPAIDRLHVETLSRTVHLLNAAEFLSEETAVFINFDPSLFAARSVSDASLREIRRIMDRGGIAPERLVCEVTEQTSSSDVALFGFVEALRGHGFRVAVDDFGAKDSDIHRIDRLKPDIVKFDADWISKLMQSGPGYALLAQMVATFRARGIATVFEGVEQGWQLELADKCGVSMVQGFGLARPVIVPAVFAVPIRETLAVDAEDPAEPETAEMAEAPARSRPFGRRGAAQG